MDLSNQRLGPAETSCMALYLCHRRRAALIDRKPPPNDLDVVQSEVPLQNIVRALRRGQRPVANSLAFLARDPQLQARRRAARGARPRRQDEGGCERRGRVVRGAPVHAQRPWRGLS